MSSYYRIGNDTINITNIDYINMKSAKKGKEGDKNAPNVYVLGLVYNSGVQVSIPFKTESEANKVRKTIESKLGVVEIKSQTLTLKK